ncbi:MAG: VCBS repeat-containing protein, partial [Actinobacteria bacterium]|nr:VCBS repeat-containing protein [Actinomycetota bacterium]
SEAGIAAAIHNHAWSDLTSGIPAGLADGDDDTLGGLSCPTGQIAKMTESGWDCADDDGSSDAETLDGLDSTDFLGASAQATDSAALGGDPASSFFGGGAVVDAAGLPLLGATCLLNGGYLLALAQDGSPYCSPAGGTGLYADSGQTLGTNASWNLALGDLDGDGDLDAYVANESQPNRVWINNGNGVFTDSGQALGTAASHGVALGDLDGDGDLDAYVANTGGNRTWFNDGPGTFTGGQSLGTGNSMDGALGDLDGDGDVDAFVGNISVNRVWLNNGLGTFTDSGQELGSSTDTYGVALGDLDGDGDLDAYAANGAITIGQANRAYFNDGAGVFTDGGQAMGDQYRRSRDVALGDLDGDGDLDVFVVNDSQTANRVWLNDGAGAFTDSQGLGNSSSRGVGLGDLDGDGDLDAFVVNDDHAKRVWLNDGTGSFTDSGQVLTSSNSRGVALGDLDGNGSLDAFVADSGQANRVWFNG